MIRFMAAAMSFRNSHYDHAFRERFTIVQSLNDRQAKAYIQTCHEIAIGARPHHDNPDELQLSYKTRDKRFGRGGLKQANEVMGDLIAYGEHWSKADSTTKSYGESEQLREFHDSLKFDPEEYLKCEMFYDGKSIIRLPSGIASLDVNGNKTHIPKDAVLSVAIPCEINVAAILWLQYELEAWEKHFYEGWPKPPTLQAEMAKKIAEDGHIATYAWIGTCLRSIRMLLSQSHSSSFDVGHVPSVYLQHSTGRLYIDGASLQTVPSIVRRAATEGHWEYDISNCHWTILNQIAANRCVRCDHITDYLLHKKEIREQLASDTGASVKQVKSALLALIYGAPLSRSPKVALHKTLGQAAQNAFCDHQIVKGLYSDLNDAREAAISDCKKRGGMYVNQAKKGIPQIADKRHVLAHIVQGYEAAMLYAALPLLENITVLQHDGFTCRTRQPKRLIERQIAHQTGMKVELEEEEVRRQDTGRPLTNTK